MKLLALIAAATVAELSLAGAVLGLLSIGGRWNGWLDVVAEFAPLWLAFSVAAALLAWPAFEPGPERRLVLLAALVGVAANAVLVAPEFLRAIPTASGQTQATPLKVLTFNVWDDDPRRDETVTAILAADADIVALQELENFDAAQRARLTAVYPYWDACPAGCDLAILSKRPWTDTSPQTPDGKSRFLAIWGRTTAPDGGPVEVLTTHLLWPAPPKGQARQRAYLARIVGGMDRSNMILTGDFNLAPWSAALTRQDADFKPLIRRTRAVFTWPAMIARLDLPAPFPILPIDQIYASPAWRTVSVTRLPRAGSDHYGVLATFVRAAGGGG